MLFRGIRTLVGTVVVVGTTYGAYCISKETLDRSIKKEVDSGKDIVDATKNVYERFRNAIRSSLS